MNRLDSAMTEPAGRAGSAEIAQEKLDFLAMMAGLKPVFVTGRGVEAAGWPQAVGALAADEGLTAIEGPLWDATPWQSRSGGIALPEWYAEQCRSELAGHTAIAICRTKSIAADIESVKKARGRLSMAEEARLLGYPPCCVAAHYERALRYHRATLSMLRRLGGDDPVRMQELLAGGANMAPATDDEIADLDAAFAIDAAPFGSWNRCAPCAAADSTPSSALSARYRKLALAVAPDLANTLQF